MEAVGKIDLRQSGRGKEWHFYNLSDMHLGNVACAKGRLAADIAAIKADPYARVWLTGDLGEYITARDSRSDFSCLDRDIFDITDLGNIGETISGKLLEILTPIKDKILGIGIGNHEWAYAHAENQESIHRALCVQLGVRYLGYTALVDTVFHRASTRVSVRHLLSHGCGGAQTPGGKINTLRKYMYSHDADIYWIGHLHDKKADRMVTIGADRNCKTLKERVKLGVISGSYFRTYVQGHTTYGEVRGYAPTHIGPAKVTIIPFTYSKRNGKEANTIQYFAEV